MTWVDFDIFLRKGTDGDIKIMYDEDAIVNSIRNICTTLQGQRRMLPDFALPIYGLLFEPMDEETANKLGNAILDAINKWDDRPEIKNVHVNINEDAAQYEINLTFSTKDSLRSEPQTFSFILNQQG